jgi:nitrogen regulatory protein PII
MSDRTITYLTDVVLLTIVAQRGQGGAILKAARDIGATIGAIGYHVTGIGARERLGLIRLAVETEREVISFMVPSDHQDVVLDQIYRAGKLDTPGNGYIYSTPLEKVATYIPESLRERLEKPESSVA